MLEYAPPRVRSPTRTAHAHCRGRFELEHSRTDDPSGRLVSESPCHARHATVRRTWHGRRAIASPDPERVDPARLDVTDSHCCSQLRGPGHSARNRRLIGSGSTALHTTGSDPLRAFTGGRTMDEHIHTITNRFCSRCRRALLSEADQRRRLHIYCLESEAHPPARMTPADWRAVAGWLDPYRSQLMGNMGSE